MLVKQCMNCLFELTSMNLQIDNTFVDITEVLNGSSISENDVDLYWIAKGFYDITREISRDFIKMKDLTYVLLEKEDNAMFKYAPPRLPKFPMPNHFLLKQFSLFDFRHLTNLDIFHALPLEKWYSSCFAGVLPKLSLIRIWDKICGKSKKIIVFVFIVLFNTQRVKVFRFKTVKEVLDHIDTVNDPGCARISL